MYHGYKDAMDEENCFNENLVYLGSLKYQDGLKESLIL